MVNVRVALEDIHNFKSLVGFLNLSDHLLEGAVLKVFDVPAVPDAHLEVRQQFLFLHILRFSNVNHRHGQVKEDVLEVNLLNLHKGLDHFESLQASDRCSCCGEGRHDSASLELNSQPVHLFQLVTRGTAVSHSVDDVNVVVSVIVFLEILLANEGLFEWFDFVELQSCKHLLKITKHLCVVVLSFLLRCVDHFFLSLLLLFFIRLLACFVDLVLDFFGLSVVGNECFGLEESGALGDFSAELITAGLFGWDLNEKDCGTEAC